MANRVTVDMTPSWRNGRAPAPGELDMRRLKEAIHYISANSTPADRLGSVKLNKILYYADMLNYAEAGVPLTGATYVKRQRGPVPKQVLDAIDELKAEKRLIVEDVSIFDFVKRDFTPLGETDISVFNGTEIERINRAMKFVSPMTADEVSDLTHTIVWNAAEMGEELPYDAFFVSVLGEATEADTKAVEARLAKR